jgi:tRNA (adenine57-N1/adenine58-N1)-methyltransferase
MKARNLVLLFSANESYVVEVSDKIFHTKSGMINLKDVKKRKIGERIKTHLGKEFLILEPTIIDFFNRKAKRIAQVILPKDAAMILAYTGIKQNSKICDIGIGSGFLSCFLAYYLKPCKIVAYEKDERMIKVAKENLKVLKLEKWVKIKKKDAYKGIDEKNFDLITIDLQYPEKVIKHVYKSLKVGGYLVIYSPTVEELLRVKKEIKKLVFCELKAIENIVREWQLERTTRPKTMGIMHTGFLIFARKLK